MNRLRNRLILIFLAATLAPLAATVWVTTSLLELSFSLSSTTELDTLSKSLKATGQEFYQRARDDLKRRALAGEAEPTEYLPAQRAAWPEAVRAFAENGEPDAVVLSGQGGDRMDYLVRHGDEVWVYSAGLGGVGLDRIAGQIGEARALVNRAESYDFRRGFKLGYLVLAAAFWLASFALLVYMAHRISRPIQGLTAGLGKLAAGDLSARVESRRDD